MKPSKRMKDETRKFQKVKKVLFPYPDLNFVKSKFAKHDSKRIILKSDLELRAVKMNGDFVDILITEGFIFDGASIPKLLRPFIGKPDSKDFMLAAAIHDYFYQSFWYDRTFADEVFYLVLRANGVSAIKASLMFLGVRFAGLVFKQ